MRSDTDRNSPTDRQMSDETPGSRDSSDSATMSGSVTTPGSAASSESAGSSEPADAPGPARPADSGSVGTETFELLSDETRVRVVQALDETGPGGLRFSELRNRVGVRDGGRFNYHLTKLRGRLVEKSGETYVLTPAGEDVAAIL